MSEKIENSTAHLLNSMRNHVNALADEKVIDPVRIRYAIEDRKNLAAQFHAQGLSNRASAEALGVDERTIRRDLANAAIAAPDNESPIESGAQPAANAAFDPALHDAFVTLLVLVRATILMLEDRRSGAYDDDSWVCDMWMSGRHLRDNARTFARLLPDNSKVAILALKAELCFSELEKEIIKSWRPKRELGDDEIALASVLEKVGEMGDVEFWTPLKKYFPDAYAVNMGGAP
jgi:hypothetical protein